MWTRAHTSAEPLLDPVGGRWHNPRGALPSWELHPPAVRCSCDSLPLSLTPSNKPNPNQISVNNVKAGVVNGAGAPGQSPGAGRACESCYSKCLPPGAHPSPQRWALAPSWDRSEGGDHALLGEALPSGHGVPGPGAGGWADGGRATAV